MKHFIEDVRKDLNAPNLPFVIAAMGQNGSKPASGAMLTVREAQMSMNDVPEFKGNVKAFRTDVLVDKAAEDLYPTLAARTSNSGRRSARTGVTTITAARSGSTASARRWARRCWS